eukprot:11193513-Lingulodinium_polyedra.AAC.1
MSGRRQADALLRAAVDEYNTVLRKVNEDRWQAVDIGIAFVGEWFSDAAAKALFKRLFVKDGDRV